jgi:hypothetical protein
MHTVAVPSHDGGWMRNLAFAENAALWQVHRRAIELHSWTPSRDPERAGFDRIILVPTLGASLGPREDRPKAENLRQRGVTVSDQIQFTKI